MSSTTRQCSKCGAAVPTGSSFCPNCGTPYSESSSVAPTEYAGPSSPAQSPLAPTQYAGSPTPIPPTQYASPTTDPYGSSSYGASNPTTDPYSSASYAAPPSDPYGGSSYAPPPANPYSSSPYGTETAPPPPKAPAPAKRPPIAVIVGAVILLLVLAGGGVFFFTSGKKASTTTTKTGTTPTVNPASLTVTAEASNALFFDNFADNSKGWTVGKTANTSSSISNHSLVLENDSSGILNEFLPTQQPFSDFKMVISYTIQRGDTNDCLCIALRTKSDFSEDYEVQLYADGSYIIGKSYLDSSGTSQFKTLVNVTTAAFNTVGKPNTVTIIMVGSTLTLMNGNTVVKKITDNSYATGQIALYVYHGKASNGITVAVTSVAVYPQLQS